MTTTTSTVTTPTATDRPRRPTPPAGRGRAATPASRGRIALLALGGACLLVGLNAALLLLGVWAPVASDRLPDVHGMVMVLGFLGTLISLERAQAIGRPWAYLAPALLGAGGLTLASGSPLVLGQLLLVEGCLMFGAVYLALWRRAPLPLVAVQVVSVLPALLASALWLVVDIGPLIALLAAFLVLTIAAERAELAQLSMGRRAVPTLVGLASVLAVSAAASLAWPDAALRVFGATVLATAAWLARDDVARRMIHTDGLRRYNAAALLAGYFWLGAAGLTWLLAGVPEQHATYDIVIHATFLGFGVSMVMAHAPIILPAVLGRSLPYRPVSWVPLIALHVGMLARVVGVVGDWTPLWQAGSVLALTALLLFVVVSLVLVVRAR